MSNKCFYIPKIINQEYVFLWKRDELVFQMIPALFLIVVGGFFGIVLFILGVFFMTVLVKSKGVNKRNGYMLHWIKFNVSEQAVMSLFSRKKQFNNKKSWFKPLLSGVK